ncbi:hypothetical protein FQR65_LT00707 [Abscondita terminalis]|nr:hypothetical protein FQR65_LT00707 [Abscondita terminalis]
MDSKQTFEHFCLKSINDRVQNHSNLLEMSNIKCSSEFTKQRVIAMNNLQPSVTLLSKGQSPSNSISLVPSSNTTCDIINNNKLEATQNNEIIDITGDNLDPICIDADDDVVIVPNSAQESTDYIPLEIIKESNRRKKENINIKNTKRDTSVIEIADTQDDLIFVTEENIGKTNSRFRKRKNINNNKNTLMPTIINVGKLKKKKRKKKITEVSMKLAKNIMQNILANELVTLNLKPSYKPTNTNCSSTSTADNNYTQLVTKVDDRLHTKQKTPKLSLSFSDFQNNMCNIQKINRTGLREIIIDGSNIAMGHSNNRFFSVKGLEIAIAYFLKKGHKVTAFVPAFRQKYNQTSDVKLLKKLSDQGCIVFTPSREVNGRRITPYDDRYIIQYATACEGIVVSNDNFRDLFLEKPEWRETIEKRLLMPTWVGDVLMFPEDPLGRNGPNLNSFLRFPV